MIKTFRGLLPSGTQDTIVLHTNDGKTGYRIVKFQVIGNEPGEEHLESTVKIYKVSQTTVDNTVDFSSQILLGVAYYQDRHEINYLSSMDVIFDKEIFNQDIYITHAETDGSNPLTDLFPIYDLVQASHLIQIPPALLLSGIWIQVRSCVWVTPTT